MALQNLDLPIVIQQFVETIENNSKDLLLEGGTESFLKEYNITDGMEFLNAVLKHYVDLTPNNEYMLMTIEFLQGEYKLIMENNKDFLIDWYLYYLSKNNRPLVDVIFCRKLLRDKTRMRDMILPEFITEMLELPGCPDDLKEIYTLKPVGFGRYADPENGEIVAKMQNGKLVPV